VPGSRPPPHQLLDLHDDAIFISRSGVVAPLTPQLDEHAGVRTAAVRSLLNSVEDRELSQFVDSGPLPHLW
jgi:hypothetical protein